MVPLAALLPHQKSAPAIVAARAAYIMIITQSPPNLYDDSAPAVAAPALLAAVQTRRASTLDTGQGRLERRTRTQSTALAAYLAWPGQQQIFQLLRRRISLRTGAVSCATVEGLSSLAPARADAAFVLARVRAHWIIENGSPHVRDVTVAEDQAQVRTGSIPQVMAARRNTAIARLRVAGETNIARACRRLAAHPWQALALRGIPTPTIE